MSNPLALVTVTFHRPVTGLELMVAVKELSYGGEVYTDASSFEVSQRYDNGEFFTIGQFSPYPYEQLLVAPSKEQHEILLDGTYSQVEVMSHVWPGRERYRPSYEYSAFVNAVRDFAQKLEQHFADPSKQPTESSVWPQEVTTCALCGRIVTRLFEGVACSQDGNNPPTTMVKVVPATS